MLAELLYVEGSYKQKPLRDMLLEKAFLLFAYVDRHSCDFSLTRKARMSTIKGMLGSALNLDDIMI